MHSGAHLPRLKASSGKLLYVFPVILAAYGLLHVVIRLVISEGAELDEAEQLLLSQAFAIGYTDQPPLYTWLLIGFEAIFGVDILSLAILKNVLLFITHFCLFLVARIVLNDCYLAGLTSLSLWLVPQIAWESHRDLTHSVLVTSVSSGFFYVMVRLLHTGQTRHYLMLGLLVGLGALSKHSFLLVTAALFIAVLSQPEARRRLLDRRMLLAGALAALVVLPHFLWLLDHFHPDTSPTTRKLGLQSDLQSMVAVGKGLGELLWASIRFLTPFWLICLLAFPQLVTRRIAGPTSSHQDRQTLERFFLMVFIILAAAVILFGVTHFKDRWMQPFLSLVPLYVFVRLQDVGGLAPGGLQTFTRVLAFFGFIFLVAPLAQAWVAPRFGMYSRLHAPFEEAARQLRQAGFRQGTIMAETTFLGGNLRLVFPTSRVLTPNVLSGMGIDPPHNGQCLAVWDGSDRRPLPSPLRSFIEETLQAQLPNDQALHSIDARFEGSHQRVFSIGFLLVPDGLGACR
ncbi:MAG TPA: glycosyltransferase family 39 protein [Candidatus Tectomicrobia bacterium]|nr:glycosyltransferase family 39 protein [Candidatus Tectomicrobia bacterium]